jgi:hypothetical protein
MPGEAKPFTRFVRAVNKMNYHSGAILDLVARALKVRSEPRELLHDVVASVDNPQGVLSRPLRSHGTSFRKHSCSFAPATPQPTKVGPLSVITKRRFHPNFP